MIVNHKTWLFTQIHKTITLSQRFQSGGSSSSSSSYTISIVTFDLKNFFTLGKYAHIQLIKKGILYILELYG